MCGGAAQSLLGKVRGTEEQGGGKNTTCMVRADTASVHDWNQSRCEVTYPRIRYTVRNVWPRAQVTRAELGPVSLHNQCIARDASLLAT